jgi:uncharacterized DUF497 family protein
VGGRSPVNVAHISTVREGAGSRIPALASEREEWNRLLVVAHAECGDELRIISARLATRRERQNYEEDN